MGIKEGSIEGEEGREKEVGEGSCRVGVSEVNAASSNCFRLRIVAATRIVVTPLPSLLFYAPLSATRCCCWQLTGNVLSYSRLLAVATLRKE